MSEEIRIHPEILEYWRRTKEASRLEAERRLREYLERTSEIYWSHALKDIICYSEEFGRVAARDSVLKFPDGSICVSRPSDLRDAFNAIHPPEPRTGGIAEDGNVCGRIRLTGASWRSLESFPNREYGFAMPYEYLERIGGEMGLLVAPALGQPAPSPGEHNLANLSVAVRFWRMLPASERAGFEAALMAWEKSVCEDRALGPVQARLKPGTLTFAKREISFRIDASGANQDVLNWLVISIVNFGVEKHPVTEVRFAETA
ncbi:MAG: hypothetical protein M0Z50_11220 [Planctomycetia bacterium]|nr:hypothetical protein [Planctomycetia bacterium]